MKSEGWRPRRRQTKPLLTAKQRAARLKFAKHYKNLTVEEWDDFLFSDECPKICFSCPIQKMILFGVLRKAKFLQHIRLKKVQSGSYGAEWQAAVSLGYIFYPQGQTLTADCYINNILEKEVKTVLHHKNVNEATDKRKLFSSNRHMTFVQDGAPAHAAKATQAWCKKNLPNFIEKTCRPQIPQISSLWRIFGA